MKVISQSKAKSKRRTLSIKCIQDGKKTRWDRFKDHPTHTTDMWARLASLPAGPQLLWGPRGQCKGASFQRNLWATRPLVFLVLSFPEKPGTRSPLSLVFKVIFVNLWYTFLFPTIPSKATCEIYCLPKKKRNFFW